MKLTFGSLVLLACLSRTLAAQRDNETTRKTLVGLRGVSVQMLITADSAAAARDGLSETDLESDVERRLRLAGVAVLPDSQTPQFILRLSVFTNNDESRGAAYAFNVEASLFEKVCSPMACLSAPTWTPNQGVIGMAARPHGDGIRQDVRDLTDEFISAYLAVNPKR